MSRRWTTITIAVLVVVAVALAILVGVLAMSGGDHEEVGTGNTTAPTSSVRPAADPTTDPDPAPADADAGADEPAAGTPIPVPDQVPPPAPPPVPVAPPEPTFVECLFGTPGPARFSDGSIRNHLPCTQTPEAQRSLEAERVCGGMYGWQEVSRERYIDLCGAEPPAGG